MTITKNEGRPWTMIVAAAVLSIGLFAATLTGSSVAPTARADYDVLGTNVSWTELSYCIGHIPQCVAGKDAQQWAESVADWKFGSGNPSLHNGRGDAFRHCAWNGAMAQRIGKSGALAISENHEVKGSQPAREAAMDTFNNNVGATIGDQSNAAPIADKWGYVLEGCYKRAISGGLVSLT